MMDSIYIRLNDGTPIIQSYGKVVAIQVGYDYPSNPFWHWRVNYQRGIRVSRGEASAVASVISTLSESHV